MGNNIPSDLQYTKSHEWVRQVHGEAPNGAIEIGITIMRKAHWVIWSSSKFPMSAAR